MKTPRSAATVRHYHCLRCGYHYHDELHPGRLHVRPRCCGRPMAQGEAR